MCSTKNDCRDGSRITPLLRGGKKIIFPLFTLLNHSGNSFEFIFLMKVEILTFQIEHFWTFQITVVAYVSHV